MVNIIAFTGRSGAGKDYCANLFVKLLPSYKKVKFIAFADHMKVECIDKNNVSFEDVYVNKTDSVRTMMQQYGTENGRDKRGKNVWVDIIDSWYKIYKHRETYDYLIITDLRFQNEYEWIKKNNGLVISVRNNSVNKMSHISENNDIRFDYLINNQIENKHIIVNMNNIVSKILEKNKKKIQIIKINNKTGEELIELKNKINIILYYETINMDKKFIQDFKIQCMKCKINNVEIVYDKNQLYQKYYDYDIFE